MTARDQGSVAAVAVLTAMEDKWHWQRFMSTAEGSEGHMVLLSVGASRGTPGQVGQEPSL